MWMVLGCLEGPRGCPLLLHDLLDGPRQMVVVEVELEVDLCHGS